MQQEKEKNLHSTQAKIQTDSRRENLDSGLPRTLVEYATEDRNIHPLKRRFLTYVDYIADTLSLKEPQDIKTHVSGPLWYWLAGICLTEIAASFFFTIIFTIRNTFFARNFQIQTIF